MSENRELQSLVGKLKDVLTEATTSSTATQEPPPATNEQLPAQTHMANGANVKVGDLVTEAMEAVNRSSPQLLKGRGGITIGMMIPPTVDPGNGIRLDDPYIPKTPIDKLMEPSGVGHAVLDAIASNAKKSISEMMTQRSAMPLRSTRRAESLAVLQRAMLLTQAECDQLEQLVVLNDQDRPFPSDPDLSALLKDGRSSPLFKVILGCLSAVRASSSKINNIGSENREEKESKVPKKITGGFERTLDQCLEGAKENWEFNEKLFAPLTEKFPTISKIAAGFVAPELGAYLIGGAAGGCIERVLNDRR